LNIPLNTPNATALLLYQRNSILNQIQARQVDFGIQATRATIPADFTTVVQRRTAARIAPPPPSPVVPVLEIIGVGLLLAIAIPVLMDRFDRSITDSRSAASNLRSRVLVSVPAIPRRVHSGYAPRGSSWEGAFRSLAATSISTDNLPQAIMVTSPTGTIHDTVAANFARALANLGVRVALVGTVPRQRWYAHTEPQAQVPEQEEVYDYDDELALDEDRPIAAPTAEESQDPTVPSVASQDTDDSDEPAEADHHDDGSDHPTFVDLLGDAYAGQLPTDVRGLLATVEDVPNLYIVPPSANGDELSLNGLPPLLDAFSRDGIDTVVIGGPAYLEDPDATIIAWSTRNVLWAVEIGHVDSRDAQLAADRLDIAGVAPFGIAVVNRHL
jgi:Mrp family chromosome partitioning ATPase